MTDTLMTCLECGGSLPELTEVATGLRRCPHCGAYYEIATFPALYREPEVGTPAENVMVEGESTCLYHSTKKATVVCEECGAFLCTLCDIHFEGRHICPKCLTRIQSERGQSLLQPETTRYDAAAFHLAVWPLLFIFICVPYLMLVTAPIVLYLVVRYWNMSRRPDGTPSTMMIEAAVIAGIELLLGLGLLLLFALGFIAMLTA
ncbi:MAG: B-box zinc finger protein [Candidatus Hydrogenedentes bacterium]|nr:B-box zinc finger protein [Candidatus Hydrogenedentota bacterium]